MYILACVFLCSQKGNTALLRAAGAGQSKILRFLLLHGADVEARNEVSCFNILVCTSVIYITSNKMI